jgi:hypothetical protein
MVARIDGGNGSGGGERQRCLLVASEELRLYRDSDGRAAWRPRAVASGNTYGDASGDNKGVEFWQRGVKMSTEASFGLGCRGGVAGAARRACGCAQWGLMLREKALWRRCPRTSLSPLGAPFWSYTLAALWSLGKNPCPAGRAIAVPLASSPPWRRRLLRPRSAVVMLVPCYGSTTVTILLCGGQEGGCLPHIWGSRLLVGSKGSSFWCYIANLQWTTAAAGIVAMASAVRDYVEGQERTTQLATNCSGFFQHGWNHPMRYNVVRPRKRHPCLLAWGWRLHARGSNEVNLDFGGGSVLDQNYGCGASLLTFLVASSKQFRSMSFVAGVARPPRVESCSDSVLSLH